MKNIYGEEVELVYDKNETMRLLGKQCAAAPFWKNNEVMKQIRHILEARPYSFTLDAARQCFVDELNKRGAIGI